MTKFQFITHANETYSHLDSVRIVLEGGCRWVQLRMKNADFYTLKTTALKTLFLCRDYGATCIIDDHVELAREIQADGVHLGKKDMPITEARAFLGKNYIIGGTANTFEDIVMLHKAKADYIGCGPFRFTTTKERLSPILGLPGYRNILKQMREADIDIPLVAIGGITSKDIPPLIECGVSGIAISGAILNSANPLSETKNIIDLLNI